MGLQKPQAPTATCCPRLQRDYDTPTGLEVRKITYPTKVI